MAYILDPWAKTRENLSLHLLCGYTTSKSSHARRQACKTRDGISTETWRFRLSVHSSRHWTASRNARDLQGKVLEKSLGQPFCASRWDNVLLLTVFLDPPPRGVVTACKEARAKNSNVYMYFTLLCNLRIIHVHFPCSTSTCMTFLLCPSQDLLLCAT